MGRDGCTEMIQKWFTEKWYTLGTRNWVNKKKEFKSHLFVSKATPWIGEKPEAHQE